MNLLGATILTLNYKTNLARMQRHLKTQLNQTIRKNEVRRSPIFWAEESLSQVNML